MFAKRFVQESEESSSRKFSKRVLQQSSSREFSKRVLQESSPREFSKRVLKESSPREFFTPPPISSSASTDLMDTISNIKVSMELSLWKPLGCRGNVLDALDTPKRGHFRGF